MPRPAAGRPLDPLIEEVLIATLAVSLLGGAVALLFWWLTGLSPWPYVILGEVGGFGFGIAALAFTSPRHRR